MCYNRQMTQAEIPGEYIVLLDDELNEIGTAPKLASHHLRTPLHKAFSCYIFDENGQFLVTQRALGKKVWPGVWTNSVCGHPGPGESFEDAIARRANDELGATIKDIRVLLPDYRYTTPPYEGVVENEFCPVFAARLEGTFNVSPTEVEAIRWMNWDEYIADVTANPDKYSFWAKDQLRLLLVSSEIQSFQRQI